MSNCIIKRELSARRRTMQFGFFFGGHVFPPVITYTPHALILMDYSKTKCDNHPTITHRSIEKKKFETANKMQVL